MFRHLLHPLAAFALALVPACASDDTPTSPEGPGGPGGPGEQQPPPVTATGTIAYARGAEIRLVEPDGSADRALWSPTRPEPSFSVRGLVWRPDGTELAFSSDHEMATSLYERDIYAVSGNGSRLRKLTNAPGNGDLASLSKGTVTLRVQNNSGDGGPYFIYVTGAPEPQSVLIPPGTTRTLTFTNVADFGNTHQLAVAVYGAFRWYGAAAADVRPGSTADAGLLIIGSAGFQNLGADGPAWRSDGSKVAFISGARTCSLKQVPASPPPAAVAEPLLGEDYPGIVCAYDWSPVATRANELLVAETNFGVGSGWISQVTEGSRARVQPLVTYNSFTQILDLRWLPDGSGFLFAAYRYGSAFNENGNLYEYSFATKTVRQVTQFEKEFIRAFTISPDGQRIAFERAAAMHAATADVWVMRRDGSEQRVVARNARGPAWNPKRP